MAAAKEAEELLIPERVECKGEDLEEGEEF